jgi:glycosyltransferase involved in cell wall biosynthesis
MFNSDAEARLAERLVPNLATSSTVGVGIEPRGSRESRRRKRDGAPSLLYVGRREPDKNTPALIDYFARYKSRRPGNLKMNFVGAGDPLPERDDMSEIEPDWSSDDMYRDSTVFVHPGINESFSIVLMQAWLQERPALVHADCAVTREHCERSNGGLWFRSYPEFEEILDRLLRSPELCAALGRNGRSYVEREYSWEAVLRRFDTAMARIREGRVETVAHETP